MSPFDRVEAAQEYLALLSISVADNKERIEAEIRDGANEEMPRHLELLRLVAYHLQGLERHLKASRRVLSNLYKLRRLVLKEITANVAEEKASEIPTIEIHEPQVCEEAAAKGA
jgi:hypothetical protein